MGVILQGEGGRIVMAYEEQRGDNSRRTAKDRRHDEGSGMISAYVDYSGPERRDSIDRRATSDRRAATP